MVSFKKYYFLERYHMTITKKFMIPADVPTHAHTAYTENYAAITRGSERLFLFAGDQKIEHMNKDFYGPAIAPDAIHPEHLFKIADAGHVGAFATQLGLVARYGKSYSNAINYIIKLNSKTDLIAPENKDPLSTQLWSVDQVVEFQKNSGLAIRGVGYTLYLGSEYENIMLHQAAQVIYQAHQHGLVTIVWVYPRGAAVNNEKDAKIIAGAAGIANCLGSDFAKINAPITSSNQKNAELLHSAVQAAGNTKLICSGGKTSDKEEFLKELQEQLAVGISGCATGRNIYQRPLPEAIALTHAIADLVY